ncbi:MAG TPA: alpha/beta hydrolase [Oculatellaceae cyanobacterium]
MNRPRKYLFNSHSALAIFTVAISLSSVAVFADEVDKTADATRLDNATAKKIVSEPRFTQPIGWQWGHFKNGDAATIRYGLTKADKPIGTVILLPGFTEFAEVYFETASELKRNRLNVFAMDWRGAGGSERFIKSDRSTSFGTQHDLDDLDQFINVVVKKQFQCKLPIFLVAHSFGGIVVLRYLHDHPRSIAGAAISAPPLACPGATAPSPVVLMCSWLMCRYNKGDEFVPGQGTWELIAKKVSKMSSHSHDPERVRLEEAWATVNPRLASGGATWRWLLALQQSCDKINDSNYSGEIDTPILLGCATDDHIANLELERKLAKSLPQCLLTEVKGARHELFLESDSFRDPWMSRVETFLKDIAEKAH